MADPNNDSVANATLATNDATTKPSVYNLDELPEHLILHILSHLPTLDTVTTSLVSRKWRTLWSVIPSLNFSYADFPPYSSLATTRQFFAEFVDRTIICRSHAPLTKFRIDFIYEDRYGSHVDSWIRYAIKNGAQELDLDFFIDTSFHVEEPLLRDSYDFPFSALRNGNVRALKLTRCDLTLPANIKRMRFWSMKSIYLDQTYLPDQMAVDLISGCPNLEVLELRNCYGMGTLKVCSKKLKELELMYFIRNETEVNLEIDCPNLVSLSIVWFEVGKCCVRNLSSLVQFNTSIGHKWDDYYGNYWRKIVRMLDQVPHIKRLTLQNWWLKVEFSEGFLLYNLKHLELQTGYSQHDLLGMAALLELAPNVETMILHYIFDINKHEDLSEEQKNKRISLSMRNLKEVKMTQFAGTENEAQFLAYLKNQGVALEKIVVVLAKEGDVQHPPIIMRKRSKKVDAV